MNHIRQPKMYLNKRGYVASVEAIRPMIIN